LESKPIDTRSARPASVIPWIILIFFVMGGMVVVSFVLAALLYLKAPTHSDSASGVPYSSVQASPATDPSASHTATVPTLETGSSPSQPALVEPKRREMMKDKAELKSFGD
jgi:hypothetical protein